jgi:hypothetical protein
MAFLVLVEGSTGSVFMILVSPPRGTRTDGGTARGEAGGTGGRMGGGGDDGGGEPPLGWPGELPSSSRGILLRRAAVFVLIMVNVEALSGVNPNT